MLEGWNTCLKVISVKLRKAGLSLSLLLIHHFEYTAKFKRGGKGIQSVDGGTDVM